MSATSKKKIGKRISKRKLVLNQKNDCSEKINFIKNSVDKTNVIENNCNNNKIIAINYSLIDGNENNCHEKEALLEVSLENFNYFQIDDLETSVKQFIPKICNDFNCKFNEIISVPLRVMFIIKKKYILKLKNGSEILEVVIDEKNQSKKEMCELHSDCLKVEPIDSLEINCNAESNFSKEYTTTVKAENGDFVRNICVDQLNLSLTDEIPNIDRKTTEQLSKCDENTIENDSFSDKQLLDLKSNTCQFCNRSFSTKDNLKVHVRIHTEDKRYKCTFCQKLFRTKACMERHEFLHTGGEKVYKCDDCNEVFKKKTVLREHERIYHDDKRYKCDVCEKPFKRREHLNRHILTHTDVKPYNCDLCHKSFNQKVNLTYHLRIHTGEKPFECDFRGCQKKCTRKIDLERHKLTHSDKDKPFQCHFCGKRFIQKNHLDCHIRLHTGEKPFKCTYCDKAFSKNYVLKIHTYVHTGEKPYKCECGKSFSQQVTLKVHRYTHTGIRPHKCELCGRSFNKRALLNKHKLAHNDQNHL